MPIYRLTGEREDGTPHSRTYQALNYEQAEAFARRIAKEEDLLLFRFTWVYEGRYLDEAETEYAKLGVC